ncbi:MAG TPA: hypothetical protein VIG62_17280 [Blastocatellia bacterium]
MSFAIGKGFAGRCRLDEQAVCVLCSRAEGYHYMGMRLLVMAVVSLILVLLRLIN